MHLKCGSLAKAQNIVEKLPVRNVVSCNALISGYAQHGYAGKALYCFKIMQNDSITPSEVTFIEVIEMPMCYLYCTSKQQS